MVLATLVTFLWPLIALLGYLAWQRSPSALYTLMGLAGLLALVGVALLATQGEGVGAAVAVIGGLVLILLGAGLAWWAWKALP
jgi:peptidoglycan/LPS O-acetylase OafA/YrhL